MHDRHLRLMGLLMSGILLLCSPLMAQDTVEVELSEGGLSFEPLVEFKLLTFTLTGPDAACEDKVFKPGDPLFYDIREAQEPLADGRYTYELRLTPILTNEEREKLAELRAKGKTIGTSAAASGDFTIFKGQIVLDKVEKVQTKDFTINDDLIVDGSACIGFDCVNGEVFSFDTIRLKENNLRIKFDDTSVVPSFPANDWQLTANDSANGGANKFSIEDISGGRTVFTVEANAPSHSLYVDDGGRIGFGTSVPSVELHVIDGDTPTLRLQQDNSSGFEPQTWDVAGNETNFFVRDVTGGSALPFRIRPGAPSNSIFVDVDGDVGIGTSAPTRPLHVLRTDGSARIVVEDTASTGTTQLLRLESDAQPRFTMVNNAGSQTWHVQVTTSNDSMTWVDASGGGTEEMILGSNGDLTIAGSLLANGGADTFPDYVFESDYELMPLDELDAFIQREKHLPNVPNAETVAKTGINMTAMQLKLVEKVEELTLYTIEQHKLISEQQTSMAEQRQLIAELQQRLGVLEAQEAAQN